MSVTTGLRSSPGRVGENAPRPDGRTKVQGRFAYSSDLWAEGMLWGRVLRSPYPAATVSSIDTSGAWRIPGVRAVLLAEDVPGSACYGLEHADQPVFASEVVRYMGEPVAAVAADHPEMARLAAEAIVVDYEIHEPLVDPERAIEADPIHPDGNVFRHLCIRHGDPSQRGVVSVEGTYEVGMQDQAFMGPESGLAIPAEDGGVDLYISTQWLHVDRDQVAACLDLPAEKVRLHLAGVGGAFGAREDVSLQVHACLLALRTGRPVKVLYSREESFFGHVHRHPARMRYRHHADAGGRLVTVEATIILDGGAYASSSTAVIANAACFGTGPYRVPNALIDGWAVRTNNPPCGAMRGFGAVQTCFAYEAQMDKLAQALGLDPVEIRLRNALASGDTMITGQVIRGTAPVARVIRTLAEFPLGADLQSDPAPMALPGGAGRTAERSGIRCRGVGFAVGYKNLMYSEGFDDYSTARCRLENATVTITSAAAEVGQGFVTLAQQIARQVLGVDQVVLAPVDTTIGSAGSTSASRQSWMSGGAVEKACLAVREKMLEALATLRGLPPGSFECSDERAQSFDGSVDLTLAQAAAEIAPLGAIEETARFRHAPTQPLNADGQGNAHVSFVFVAHRAVVDVDVELGLIKVVEIATSQDVGKVLNPVQVLGQIEGGIAQGVGLAVMEEIVVDRGVVRNPSFTDYLIPTALDMPVVRVAALIEEPEPGAPFGAKGVGEPPTISSTAAVVAAVRAATGIDLNRVPIRPQDIALARPDSANGAGRP